MEQPLIETARLALRPFVMADAPAVQRLAGAWEVANTSLNMPHPYPDGAAEAWIARHPEQLASGEAITYAITLRCTAELMGSIALYVTARFHHGELGYWIGMPYWNHGYMTEAAGAVLKYGFEALSLHRILARHITRNPASGRVMQKIGMTFEGVQRQHVCRDDGQYEDLALYGILRSEYKVR